MDLDIVKSYLVGTRLGELAEGVRWIMSAPERKRHPELSDLHQEGSRIKIAVGRLINESSNCIDVGCHVGSMLDLFVKMAPRGHHIAFEPVPWKARWLVRKYPQVQVKQMALSDMTGEVEFSIVLGHSGFSGLATAQSRSQRTREIKVACERLDRLVPADHRVDLLKVDVEGAELMVFRGAEGVLQRDRPPIIFESARDAMTLFGRKPADIFDHLAGQYDYSLFTPRGFLEGAKPLTPEEFDSAHDYPFKAFNFLAIPPGRDSKTQ